MSADIFSPIHPGEILLEEYLKPLGISRNRLGIDLGIPPQRIGEIVRKRRSLTLDTALRLAKYFGTSPQFWMGLQSDYDLDIAQDKLGDRLDHEIRSYSITNPGAT